MPVPSRRPFNCWQNANGVEVAKICFSLDCAVTFALAATRFVLNELLLVLPHDQDRARRVPHDAFGSAPHEHVLETDLAVGCQNNQIDCLIMDDVRKDLKGASHLDKYVLEKFWFDPSVSQFFEFFLD